MNFPGLSKKRLKFEQKFDELCATVEVLKEQLIRLEAQNQTYQSDLCGQTEKYVASLAAQLKASTSDILVEAQKNLYVSETACSRLQIIKQDDEVLKDQQIKLIEAILQIQQEQQQQEAITQAAQTSILSGQANLQNQLAKLRDDIIPQLADLKDAASLKQETLKSLFEKESILADHITALGKDISAQLLQLDENTRMLLIHTIIGELPPEVGK